MENPGGSFLLWTIFDDKSLMSSRTFMSLHQLKHNPNQVEHIPYISFKKKPLIKGPLLVKDWKSCWFLVKGSSMALDVNMLNYVVSTIFKDYGQCFFPHSIRSPLSSHANVLFLPILVQYLWIQTHPYGRGILLLS